MIRMRRSPAICGLLIRERLTKGDSDAQVVDFVVARYGDFVLLKPRFDPNTALLWFGPFAILLIAVFVMFAPRRQAAAA